MKSRSKTKVDKLLHDMIMGDRPATSLYNTKEVAEYIGIPHTALLSAFFGMKKRPPTFVTGDAKYIYFDEKTVNALRDLLRSNKKAVGQ